MRKEIYWMADKEYVVGEFGPEAVALDVDDSEEFGCGCECVEPDCE